MGWYGSNIAGYKMFLHDSIHDYVKRSKPLKYYEDFKIDVEFFLKDSDDAMNIEYPLKMIGKPKIIKKNYEFDFNIDMPRLLYYELKVRGVELSGPISLDHHIGDYKHITFYLNSDIGEENIRLSSKKIKHYKIESYKDLEWIWSKGLHLK